MTHVLILSPARRADGASTMFNVATLSLASYLRRHGVSAWAEPLMGPYWLDTLDRLLKTHQPKVVAISCKWWDTLYGAVELARLVRRRLPKVTLVAGGQTATYFAEDLVLKSDFDAVVRGDGEQPLLDIALGKPSRNVTLSNGRVYPTTYVQQSSDDLRFVSDLSTIADPEILKILAHHVPFIWTGKGCRLTCLYCAGSALGHKRLFGRKGYLYRPIEHVIHDMEAMAPWSKNAFMFDFDPVADPEKSDYYQTLFQQLPEKRYHTQFYCWTLPQPEFVEQIARTFVSAFISLDAQAYSQPLRYRLSEAHMIKPYRPDADYESLLSHISQYQNLDAGVYGILGLARETEQDVMLAERWIQHLLLRFGNALGELGVTPLSSEPGALLARQPEKYGMRLTRESYEEYLDFTRRKYHSQETFYSQEMDAFLPHPYGVYDPERGAETTHHHYTRIHNMITEHFDQRRYDHLERRGDTYYLRVSNRNYLRSVWQLPVWAASMALKEGVKKVEVDAREAFVLMPDEATFEHLSGSAYVTERMAKMKALLASGELEMSIVGAPHHYWGALQSMGVKITEWTEQESSATPSAASA